ncbi:hypothetical protein BDN71DRAFT_1436039 [Pleurotus eryngii]|uniref:Uncharacterized protein n=1 Tax=Pleurotus eryngii TaxID=5323 RepID=A0A9P6DAD2_PLEER|nr:hypothetical protein BDN71DRAFT_1436039 [Pleurotus eryngii]
MRHGPNRMTMLSINDPIQLQSCKKLRHTHFLHLNPLKNSFKCTPQKTAPKIRSLAQGIKLGRWMVFSEIRTAWDAAVKQRLEERKRLEKEALQAAKAAERIEKEAAMEIEKVCKAAEKAEVKKLADAKELADTVKAAKKERKKKLADEEKAQVKVAEVRLRGELPAPKLPTKKKGGSAKGGQKWAQVDEDVDPANKENIPVQPAPKRPRPKPRPIGRPPSSSGALAAVQVHSSMNVDNALAMIDPVLRPGA